MRHIAVIIAVLAPLGGLADDSLPERARIVPEASLNITDVDYSLDPTELLLLQVAALKADGAALRAASIFSEAERRTLLDAIAAHNPE